MQDQHEQSEWATFSFPSRCLATSPGLAIIALHHWGKQVQDTPQRSLFALVKEGTQNAICSLFSREPNSEVLSNSPHQNCYWKATSPDRHPIFSYVLGCVCVSQHSCESRKTAYRNQFFPSTMWSWAWSSSVLSAGLGSISSANLRLLFV